MQKNLVLLDILAGAKALAEGLNGQLAEINCFPYEKMNAINARLVTGRLITLVHARVKDTADSRWTLTASIERTNKKYKYDSENPESAKRYIRYDMEWMIKSGEPLPMDKVVAFLNQYIGDE